MKTSRLFVVLFFISAVSGTLYAGQADEDKDQGTDEEPDCDYISVTESLQPYTAIIQNFGGLRVAFFVLERAAIGRQC